MIWSLRLVGMALPLLVNGLPRGIEWLENRLSRLKAGTPRHESDEQHPYYPKGQPPVSNTVVNFSTSDVACRSLNRYGTNVCYMCSCSDWEAEDPHNCNLTMTESDVLHCLSRVQKAAPAGWGLLLLTEEFITRYGCHGYGISDSEVQYLNGYFRPHAFSAWFRMPRGISLSFRDMSLAYNTRLTIDWGRQRQICDSSPGDDYWVFSRVAVRSPAKVWTSQDPHISCISQLPQNPASAHVNVLPSSHTYTFTLEVDQEIFGDQFAIGPEDWLAIDVSMPLECVPRDNYPESEYFLNSDVWSAKLHITHPVMWIAEFNFNYWDKCCALNPNPSKSGWVLDQSQNSITTKQWVADGGVKRGVAPELCDFLEGRVISATPECLDLPVGTHVPLDTLVNFDWQ